jgi:hypothetical protein
LRRIFGPEKQDIREVHLKLNSWTCQPLKMIVPSKHRELIAFWHSIISQKNGVISKDELHNLIRFFTKYY